MRDCTPFDMLLAIGFLVACSMASADEPYKDAKLAPDKRVADLLPRLTLEEKVSLVAGATWMKPPRSNAWACRS